MAGIKDTDRGYKSLMERLSQLTKKEVAVGIPAGQIGENGVNLAVIGAVHEFGTVINQASGAQIVMPERSFLRSTLRDDQEKIKNFANNRAKEVVLNKSSPDDALNKLGLTVVGLVQKKIQSGNFVPNAPSTVRRKKSDKPLIDTGRLRQSITHKVRNKGQDSIN